MSPLFLAALFACSDPAPAPEPAPEPAEAAPAPEPEKPSQHPGPSWKVKSHMDQHFAYVTDALFFTFRGDLDGVKSSAKKLAEHEDLEGAPENWKPHLDTMRSRAEALAKVEDLDAAARGVVELAGACSDCHEATNGPKLTKKDMEIDPLFFGDGAMDRHQWAVYMMWVGLSVPSEEMYVAGTEAFAHDKGALPELPEGARPLENKVHDLAARGHSVETWEARGAVFAEMIGTCAECHEAAGVTSITP